MTDDGEWFRFTTDGGSGNFKAQMVDALRERGYSDVEIADHVAVTVLVAAGVGSVADIMEEVMSAPTGETGRRFRALHNAALLAVQATRRRN